MKTKVELLSERDVLKKHIEQMIQIFLENNPGISLSIGINTIETKVNFCDKVLVRVEADIKLILS